MTTNEAEGLCVYIAVKVVAVRGSSRADPNDVFDAFVLARAVWRRRENKGHLLFFDTVEVEQDGVAAGFVKTASVVDVDSLATARPARVVVAELSPALGRGSVEEHERKC